MTSYNLGITEKQSLLFSPKIVLQMLNYLLKGTKGCSVCNMYFSVK